MSQLESGAEAIERRVRHMAAELGVTLVAVRWNGDEGLIPNNDTQTLFLTGTQHEARATLSSDEMDNYEARGNTETTDHVLRSALSELATPADAPTPPAGGGGQ
jgi:hypothetical protein